ncbi:MAG: TonB-dependent receptor plug domain-containing protein [Candidatus Kapaibacteriales bacterium]
MGIFNQKTIKIKNKIFLSILFTFLPFSDLFSTKQIELFIKFIDESNQPVPNVQVVIHPKSNIFLSNNRGNVRIRTDFDTTKRITAFKSGFSKFDTTLYINPNVDSVFVVLKMYSFHYQSGEIVITATRTEKELLSIPIPMTTIYLAEAKKIAVRNLDEVLSEFTSLPLVDDHGRGVQLQGLDPDYTLLLINGEPIINRTGGILDISRFYLGNINKIEIVRGPNSSIYGSNALAGVINILTAEPTNSFEFSTSGKLSSYKSYDIAVNLAQVPQPDFFSFSTYYNFSSTDGYKLNPSSFGKTIPEMRNHTFQAESFLYITQRSKIKFSFRGSIGDEFNQYLNISSSIDTISSFNRVYDFISSLSYRNATSSYFNYEYRIYGSYFSTRTEDKKFSTYEIFDEYQFSQRLLKSEFQGNYVFSKKNYFTFGLGYQTEEAKSLRIEGGKQKNDQLYFYLQDDYFPIDQLNIIASLRFDKHSDYSSQINPKLALSYKLTKLLTFRTSIGTGFKAPSFEELYLDWTNPMAGYSVFGAMNAVNGITQLQNTGQIVSLLIPIDSIPHLNPEKSLSIDIGGNIQIDDRIWLKLNFFRNNVSDLIDFLPIAYKTNGQRVHTYQNLNKIFTQGFEISGEFSIFKDFIVSASYQFLQTGDVNLISKIKERKIFKRDANGFDRAVQLNEYGGLFHRPTHSGNLRISYNNEHFGVYTSLRVNLKDKYGYRDVNGNGILDDEREYAPGYAIFSLNFNKSISKMISLNFAINNIFNKKDLRFLAVNPGRTFSFAINFNFVKQ